MPGEIEIFLNWIHDPQISNQIDAAAEWNVSEWTSESNRNAMAVEKPIPHL